MLVALGLLALGAVLLYAGAEAAIRGATALARALRVPAFVLGALLFGGLYAGAQEMQFATDVPLQLADVLLAVILLLVTATKLVELIVGKRARVLAAGTHLERGLGQ